MKKKHDTPPFTSAMKCRTRRLCSFHTHSVIFCHVRDLILILISLEVGLGPTDLETNNVKPSVNTQ